MLSATPYGAQPDDTGEYMLGDVAVTVVLMESNDRLSSSNDNSENWTTDGLKVPVKGAAGFTDGRTFTLSDGSIAVVFEFDRDGTVEDANGDLLPDNTVIYFTGDESQEEMSSLIRNAIVQSGLGLSPQYLGNGVIELNVQTRPAFDLTGSSLTRVGINGVKEKVEEGLQWWVDTLATITDKHELDFHIDYSYADTPVKTGYEPIINTSQAFSSWIYDFLIQVGHNRNGNFSDDIRSFNHEQRETHDTDWAFTIFVVNDENDADGMFGSECRRQHLDRSCGFERAFAFSGGRFFVTPAGRPASTIAHESGHMFWAMDEYPEGGTYSARRGYYNTQNYNASDNPGFRSPNSFQQPSIMASGNDPGDKLYEAYVAHTSSQSSLEMIGWRDSDGDGIFDVLDVPLTLHGVGHYDAIQGTYRFVGESSVETYPNLNPSGLQNDITISEVSRVQYRVDGGDWQTAVELHQFAAALDFSVPLSAGATIEIRSIDDATGVASTVFSGQTNRPSATVYPGINGFVWNDADADGQWGGGESGLEGVQIQLVDGAGNVLEMRRTIEPDDYTDENTLLNGIIPQVTLSAKGSGVADNSITSRAASAASTGSRVFATFAKRVPGSNLTGFSEEWTGTTRQLRMDFNEAVGTVSIDAVANSDGDYGRLEIYNSNDKLLARHTTQALVSGSKETMTLRRGEADIAYAIARGHGDDPTDDFENRILLDNLQFGAEPTAITDANGSYALSYLVPGDYTVQVVPAANQTNTSPADGKVSVQVAVGQAVKEIDFGLAVERSSWQNPGNRFDVNGDGSVSPIDALQIINDLNTNGPRALTDADPLPPPYLDVSGDGSVSPGDVLLVINEINAQNDGEGETGGLSDGGGNSDGDDPEAEASPILKVPAVVATPRPISNRFGADLILARSATGAFSETMPGDPSPAPPHYRSDLLSSRDDRPVGVGPRLDDLTNPARDVALEAALDALAADISPLWYATDPS